MVNQEVMQIPFEYIVPTEDYFRIETLYHFLIQGDNLPVPPVAARKISEKYYNLTGRNLLLWKYVLGDQTAPIWVVESPDDHLPLELFPPKWDNTSEITYHNDIKNRFDLVFQNRKRFPKDFHEHMDQLIKENPQFISLDKLTEYIHCENKKTLYGLGFEPATLP